MLSGIVLRRQLPRFAFRALRWHITTALTRAAAPLACGLYLTSRCNFRCRFCNLWRLKPGFTLPRQRALDLVEELGGLGVAYFSISGGEPLLVPYVFEILAQAKAHGILFTHVVSNGSLMDARKAGQLAESGVSEISFSLDGDEQAHDTQRGSVGAHRGVVAAVGLVQAHAPGTDIVLNTILDPARPRDALNAVATARSLGVKIKVQPANDHPSFELAERAEPARRTFSDTERQLLEETLAELIETPHVVNSRAFLENYLTYLFRPDEALLANTACLFGYHHLEIFDGRAYPCLEGLQWQDGFALSDQPVRAVLRSAEYRATLHHLRTCRRCTRAYYVCYYEPRLHFPFWNLARSALRTWRGFPAR